MSLGLGPMAVALQEGSQARTAQQQRLQQLLAQRAFEERQQAEVERRNRAEEDYRAATLTKPRIAPLVVPAGSSLFSPEGDLLSTAPDKATPPERPFSVSPGGSLVSPLGRLLFSAPDKPTPDRPFTVSPGGSLVSPLGTLLFSAPPAEKAPPTPSFGQPVYEIDAAGNQIPGSGKSWDARTGAWVTPKGQGPQRTKPAPGAAQVATTEARKKDALSTLDKLDASIDAAAAKNLIGPGAGRVTSVEQLIGMADPEAQRLGAFMRGAKMQIDASIGGMRAAASPQLVKQWDNLLANKVTPAGLHAAVQAMREIAGGPAVLPRVRQFNPATGKVE